MKQWEYKTMRVEAFILADLNEYGKKGWEIIYMRPLAKAGFELFFKREVECARDIPIEEILNDIDAGRVRASARVRCLLRDAIMFDKAEFISQVSFRHRNFGKKSQTELKELIDSYINSVK